MSITANRYHDISCGHRVVGHESKCAHLHGHNYRIHFFIEPYPTVELDLVGRVIDFSVIKNLLCEWLEVNWDHRMLLWDQDPILKQLQEIDSTVRTVPFNPTAENMAIYLVNTVGKNALTGTGCRLRKVTIDETRKCSVSYEL